MPSIGDNQKTWQEIYDWSNGGDEWSQVWGGEDMQWYGVILPRIQAFVTDPEREHTPRTILEIAPGFGRWTKYLKDLCDRLVVVDLAPKCIDACRQRFKAWSHIEYHVNDGKSLEMIGDGSVDFIFSMDSLVHAEADVLEAYLNQMGRIQTRNAVGFIHHSNFGEYAERAEPPPQHGRATTMTAERFKRMAEAAGLRCLRQEIVNWGTNDLIDAMSVFVRDESDWKTPYKQLRNDDFMNEAAYRARLAELYGKRHVRA